MLLAERAARLEAETRLVEARAEAANAQADLSSAGALISHLKLEIEKLRRQLYGGRSERKARLLDQMELQLEELERKHRSSRPSRANSSASSGLLLIRSVHDRQSLEELTSTEAAARTSVPVRGIQFFGAAMPTSASRRKLGIRYPTRG
jgi:hypothetical protein